MKVKEIKLLLQQRFNNEDRLQIIDCTTFNCTDMHFRPVFRHT